MVNHVDRLGPARLPGPGPRPDRLPHRVPDRDPRHRPPAPRLRPLGAVGGRAAHPPDRRRWSPTARATTRQLRALQPAGARHAVRRPRRGGLRGDDRRRELARRRPRRQRRQGEAPDQRALATADVLVRLVPARQLSLDQALEFLREDECVEVTPETVRLRKAELDKTDRVNAARSGSGLSVVAALRPGGDRLPSASCDLRRGCAVSLTVGAMVYDFRHKNVEGKWKASGHCKGSTRDAAFSALAQKNGGMPEGRYMSRPRDGHAKDWDLFSSPRAVSAPARRRPPSGSPLLST